MSTNMYMGYEAPTVARRSAHGMSHKKVREAFIALHYTVMNGDEEELRKLPLGATFEPESAFRHCMDVAEALKAVKAPPEVIAAGILHDVHEDYPDEWSEARLRKEFGDPVADLVLCVSKPRMAEIEDSAERWHARNAAYFEQLAKVRSVPLLRWALGISCADKLSNMGWSIYKMRMGVNPNLLMRHPWDWDMMRLIELGRLFAPIIPAGMLFDYRQRLVDFWAAAIEKTGFPQDIKLVELVAKEGLNKPPL